jgi:hypothetical protein
MMHGRGKSGFAIVRMTLFERARLLMPPGPSCTFPVGRMVSGISPLVTRGGSRTSVAVQASPADCACSIARRVCV